MLSRKEEARFIVQNAHTGGEFLAPKCPFGWRAAKLSAPGFRCGGLNKLNNLG